MNLKKALTSLVREIVSEADHNPAFREKVEAALELGKEAKKQRSSHKKIVNPKRIPSKRPRNRRPAALLDPVQLARQGDAVLRAELEKLNIEQLRDIVSDFGMDTGKLVLKWRTTERIIERIVEVSLLRAQKGSAFLDRSHNETISNPALKSLEHKFGQAMINIYHEARSIGYTPNTFYRMLTQHGGLQTAKQLINAPNISDGYTKLWKLKRLDLSVEAVVYENPEWHPLFTQEDLDECRKRLSDSRYLTQ